MSRMAWAGKARAISAAPALACDGRFCTAVDSSQLRDPSPSGDRED